MTKWSLKNSETLLKMCVQTIHVQNFTSKFQAVAKKMTKTLGSYFFGLSAYNSAVVKKTVTRRLNTDKPRKPPTLPGTSSERQDHSYSCPDDIFLPTGHTHSTALPHHYSMNTFIPLKLVNYQQLVNVVSGCSDINSS